jgi:hypothetical protein
MVGCDSDPQEPQRYGIREESRFGPASERLAPLAGNPELRPEILTRSAHITGICHEGTNLDQHSGMVT